MIRVLKVAEPSILTANKAQWTLDLLNKINAVGGYDKLTESDKRTFVYHYKHDDIHTALKNGRPVERCIYCENDITTGDPNVEHFHPKSLYPNETFEWDNLFSACIECNRPKGDFDTNALPFIHPVNDDPEVFLSYEMLLIKPRYRATTNQVLYEKGKNVISNCKLDRGELIPSLSDTLSIITSKSCELKPLIDQYNKYKECRYKEQTARELMSKLNGLNVLAHPSKERAGFARECLRQNRFVRAAVDIVNYHAVALGIGTSYNWGWNYNLAPEI